MNPTLSDRPIIIEQNGEPIAEIVVRAQQRPVEPVFVAYAATQTPLQAVPTQFAPQEQQPLRLPRAACALWVRPRLALASLVVGPVWSWALPIGLALLLFYTRIFLLAFLGVELTEWALLGGVGAILLGWPLRTAILYSLSSLFGGQPLLFPLLVMSAWATLPLTLRTLVEVIYMLGTGQFLAYPGLSGLLSQQMLVDPAASWVLATLTMLLGKIDLYSLLYFIFLAYTISIGARLTLSRALVVATTYAIFMLFISSTRLLI